MLKNFSKFFRKKIYAGVSVYFLCAERFLSILLHVFSVNFFSLLFLLHSTLYALVYISKDVHNIFTCAYMELRRHIFFYVYNVKTSFDFAFHILLFIKPKIKTWSSCVLLVKVFWVICPSEIKAIYK